MEKEFSVWQDMWTTMQQSFEQELTAIQKEESQVRNLARRATAIATAYLRKVEDAIKDKPLLPVEEIHYYKTVKPYFFSRLLFYQRLLQIEMDRPPNNAAGVERYYTEQLVSLAAVYAEHKFIYEYLQSNDTYLDHQFFFRGQENYVIAISGLVPPADGAHRISYDHVVAQLLAAALLEKHLLDQITELQLPGHTGSVLPTITFTSPQVHFVELAYGLFAAGVFNNGKATLREIVQTMESAFNIKSGNYTRQLQEILYRKSGPTVFLDFVKNAYVIYLNRIEDKHVG